MKLYHALSLASVFIFLVLIVISKSKTKTYVLFTLFFLPFMDLPVIPVEFGGGMRVFDIISYSMLLFSFDKLIFLKSKFYYNAYYILFGAFIFAIILGSLNSQFIGNSLISISGIFPIFIFSKSLLVECNLNKSFKKEVINALKIIGLFSILFLLVQIIVGLKFTYYTELNRNTVYYGAIRYPSFFHDPQKYGQYLVLLSFLYLINYQKINQPAIINYILFIVIIFGILETGGRSALLALTAGVVLLFLTLGAEFKLILITFSLIAFLLILNFSNTFLFFDRAKTMDQDYLFRVSMWKEAYKFFLRKPIFGIGIGNYQKYAISYSNNYYVTPDKEVIFFDQPESGFWMILTELGIVGAFLTSLFFIIPIYNSVKGFLLGNNKVIVFLLLASIVSWLTTFTTVYSLNDKQILIVVISLISLLIAEDIDSKFKYEI